MAKTERNSAVARDIPRNLDLALVANYELGRNEQEVAENTGEAAEVGDPEHVVLNGNPGMSRA